MVISPLGGSALHKALTGDLQWKPESVSWAVSLFTSAVQFTPTNQMSDPNSNPINFLLKGRKKEENGTISFSFNSNFCHLCPIHPGIHKGVSEAFTPLCFSKLCGVLVLQTLSIAHLEKTDKQANIVLFMFSPRIALDLERCFSTCGVRWPTYQLIALWLIKMKMNWNLCPDNSEASMGSCLLRLCWTCPSWILWSKLMRTID